MIDGIFELTICKETVPDLETANIELDNICDLIFSSETTSTLFKPELLTWLKIISLLFISLTKSNNIGKRTLVSDLRLPGKIDIIFLFLGKKSFKTVLTLSFFSINGCPTNVFLIFSWSKYSFSKLNNKSI